jgi:hypothetical protein
VRLDEWRRFLESSIVEVTMSGDEQLRLRLDLSREVLLAAVDLAQREKSCCRFFEFSIDIKEESCWLVVRVPREAVAVLKEFAGLLPHRLIGAPKQ